jgi:cell division septum initiation protein DivIVA
MRLSATVLVGLTLAGCGSLSAVRSPRQEPVPTISTETLQALQLAAYIQSLQSLVQGSPTEQAETLSNARQAYEQARQGPAALRYGLLLAAPSHAGRDINLAQRLLREALTRPELLNLTERALAGVELQRIETEQRLHTESERLLAELQRERQRAAPPNAALIRRLQTESEENARLRKALDEARAKLDAIANIERSISDRPPATEGRNP